MSKEIILIGGAMEVPIHLRLGMIVKGCTLITFNPDECLITIRTSSENLHGCLCQNIDWFLAKKIHEEGIGIPIDSIGSPNLFEEMCTIFEITCVTSGCQYRTEIPFVDNKLFVIYTFARLGLLDYFFDYDKDNFQPLDFYTSEVKESILNTSCFISSLPYYPTRETLALKVPKIKRLVKMVGNSDHLMLAIDFITEEPTVKNKYDEIMDLIKRKVHLEEGNNLTTLFNELYSSLLEATVVALINIINTKAGSEVIYPVNIGPGTKEKLVDSNTKIVLSKEDNYEL